MILLADRPVDQDIAKGLHVSRMPVREALMQLKRKGVLNGTARGFILRRFTLVEMNETFEVCAWIEFQAAASASRQADKDLAEMKSVRNRPKWRISKPTSKPSFAATPATA